jgi:hypothetical protein
MALTDVMAVSPDAFQSLGLGVYYLQRMKALASLRGSGWSFLLEEFLI